MACLRKCDWNIGDMDISQGQTPLGINPSRTKPLTLVTQMDKKTYIIFILEYLLFYALKEGLLCKQNIYRYLDLVRCSIFDTSAVQLLKTCIRHTEV